MPRAVERDVHCGCSGQAESTSTKCCSTFVIRRCVNQRRWSAMRPRMPPGPWSVSRLDAATALQSVDISAAPRFCCWANVSRSNSAKTTAGTLEGTNFCAALSENMPRSGSSCRQGRIPGRDKPHPCDTQTEASIPLSVCKSINPTSMIQRAQSIEC